jgi:hypothetical protein
MQEPDTQSEYATVYPSYIYEQTPIGNRAEDVGAWESSHAKKNRKFFRNASMLTRISAYIDKIIGSGATKPIREILIKACKAIGAGISKRNIDYYVSKLKNMSKYVFFGEKGRGKKLLIMMKPEEKNLAEKGASRTRRFSNENNLSKLSNNNTATGGIKIYSKKLNGIAHALHRKWRLEATNERFDRNTDYLAISAISQALHDGYDKRIIKRAYLIACEKQSELASIMKYTSWTQSGLVKEMNEQLANYDADPEAYKGATLKEKFLRKTLRGGGGSINTTQVENTKYSVREKWAIEKMEVCKSKGYFSKPEYARFLQRELSSFVRDLPKPYLEEIIKLSTTEYHTI